MMADDPSALRELEHLNRLYAMLSGINRAIVRSDDAQSLFTEACRLSVEEGGFAAAWVGLFEPGECQPRVVARAGVSVPAPLCGSCGEAVPCPLRAGQPCRIDDLATDLRAAGSHDVALDAVLRASVALPLRNGGELVGAFGVATGPAQAFSEADLRLLEEVAADLSFALAALHREQVRIADQSRIEFLAYYDAHTGLPNRALCERRLREATARGEHLAVLVVELGVFHDAARLFGPGGAVLIAREAARRLEAGLPQAGVARIAENAFALWLTGLPADEAERETAAATALRIGELLAPALRIEGQDLYAAPFVGIALHAGDGAVEETLREAVVAAGRRHGTAAAGYCFYANEMANSSLRRFDLDAALRRALDHGEFLLYYQPQVDLASGEVTGAEALLRWNRPGVGLVSPLEFIPVLEGNGLIGAVGEWVLDEACRSCRDWQELGAAPLRVGVNLSARQFRDGDVGAAARRALGRSGLNPRLLELELTESIVLQDADSVIRCLRELRGEGIGTTLDDFGTGYSSLSYLQRLPVDRIKIDRSFVTDLTSNPNSSAIARAVVGMTHSLGMTAIAEGVETEGQLSYLRRLGCEAMQGYLFSPPLPGEAFRTLLRDGRRMARSDADPAWDRTLLLVDDEPNVINALSRVFRRARVRVLATTDPREAFELLARHPVGVVVSDQRMPSMSGTEFLRRVKALHPDTVRIVLSGYTELGAVIEAVNHGAIYKFLTKPWEDEALRAIVDEAFGLFELAQQNRVLTERLAALLDPALPPPGRHAAVQRPH
ncbi:EAL domain-containing protein [Aromatoleum toluclasticum]|uniref:EAL domain-containing protein n=1 Tax=Aromatoleum toluclasticum TaxID=92003 RepID=UPI001D181A91|nr:EAL domain-containing protein [Aromatoleum toluclasticum]